MLAACRANGWPFGGYRLPAHPLQQRIEALIGAERGRGRRLRPADLRDAAERDGRAVRATPERIAAAMRARPELVGGAGIEDTELMLRVPGLLAKRGAEGLLCLVEPGGTGYAFKVEDGNAAGASARRSPPCSGLRELAVAELRNSRDEPVGEIAAAGLKLTVGAADYVRRRRRRHGLQPPQTGSCSDGRRSDRRCADRPSRDGERGGSRARPAGRAWSRPSVAAARRRLRPRSPFAPGLLTFHGGPVMHTNATYAIYWVPSGYSVSTNYESLINGFFQDVAADSGKLTNVYSVEPSTATAPSAAAYNSTFGGSVVDTNAVSRRRDASTRSGRARRTSVCLTDAQIQTEIANVVTAQGWPAGSGSLFFLFTPKNVGSCYYDGSIRPTHCSFSTYCGYHGSFVTGGGIILYANLPVRRLLGRGKRVQHRESRRTETTPTRRSTSRATSTTRRSPTPC